MYLRTKYCDKSLPKFKKTKIINETEIKIGTNQEAYTKNIVKERKQNKNHKMQLLILLTLLVSLIISNNNDICSKLNITNTREKIFF